MRTKQKLYTNKVLCCVTTIITIIQKQYCLKCSGVFIFTSQSEVRRRSEDGMKVAAPYGHEVDGAQQPTFKQQSDQFHSNTRHFCLKCRHRYLDFSLARLLEVCRDCFNALSWKVRLCYVLISAGDFQATSKQVFSLLIKCNLSVCAVRAMPRLLVCAARPSSLCYWFI